MKRIGILTFHRPVNYGAFLQSFSLSNELKKRFPDAKIEIIDYIAPIEKRKIYLDILRELKYRGVKSMLAEMVKVGVFKKSLRFLSLSKESFCTDDISAFYKRVSKDYDCLIIGSDAVLNWEQNGYPSAFYPPAECTIPVFGYAVSAHGLKLNKLSEEQKQYCKDSFSRFSFIGARDNNTYKFAEGSGYDGELVHVCDPTFFTDLGLVEKNADGWEERIRRKYGFDVNDEYIVFMVNDNNLTKKLYDYYGKKYKIVTLFKNTPNADVFMYDLNPFEWVKVLSRAKVIFTQYFHGALLGLKNNVGTVIVDMAGDNTEYESKLCDVIVKRLGLGELYFTRSTSADVGKMTEAADGVLEGRYKALISDAVEKEKMTSEQFFDRLKECIYE